MGLRERATPVPIGCGLIKIISQQVERISLDNSQPCGYSKLFTSVESFSRLSDENNTTLVPRLT